MDRSALLEKYRRHVMFEESDIQRFDDHGMCYDTPLHLAAMSDEADDADFMATEIGSVDVPGDIGNTPLHMAIMFGSASVVDVLLRHGAKIDVENDYGWTPLDLVRRNSEEVMLVVRKYYPELDIHKTVQE